MGEVYRARDTKLGREVAIKVLPEAWAFDADRAARFEREAQVLESLNHPHIAALYGMEESGGRHVLVMELVEGETLAERLARGTLPVTAALEIAHQLARGDRGNCRGSWLHSRGPRGEVSGRYRHQPSRDSRSRFRRASSSQASRSAKSSWQNRPSVGRQRCCGVGALTHIGSRRRPRGDAPIYCFVGTRALSSSNQLRTTRNSGAPGLPDWISSEVSMSPRILPSGVRS